MPMAPALRMLLLLLLLLVAGRARAQVPAVNPGCDSEDALLGNLRWLRDACAQAGEQFDDDDTLVPGAVTTAGCAAVVRRVASDCGGLLARSPWFASRRAALDAADAAAAALPAEDAGTALHIAHPSLRSVHSCGAVLDDGSGLERRRVRNEMRRRTVPNRSMRIGTVP